MNEAAINVDRAIDRAGVSPLLIRSLMNVAPYRDFISGTLRIAAMGHIQVAADRLDQLMKFRKQRHDQLMGRKS